MWKIAVLAVAVAFAYAYSGGVSALLSHDAHLIQMATP